MIGRGGFGIVYLADDFLIKATVAIKELFPTNVVTRSDCMAVVPFKDANDFDILRASFLNEGRLLSNISHNSIIRFYGAFLENNTTYIIMEHLEGPNFSQWIDKNPDKRNQENFDNIFGPLADGILNLHDLGILHRDIKPRNIQFRSLTRDPVLLDFGNAVHNLDEVTRAVVTESYAPIEQFASDSTGVGPWTDVYSLAATMYLFVAGKTLIPAPNRVGVYEDLSLAGIVGPGHYRPSLLKTIEWATALFPKDRPQTIREFIEHAFPHQKNQSFSGSNREVARDIFLSYRRKDSRHFAGRLYDKLTKIYGNEKIFFDVDTIPYAVDFEEHIAKSLSTSAVLVAVIGTSWVSKSWNQKWWKVISNSSVDYVRVEIERAIGNGVPIVPVLIDDTPMPTVDQLPEGMHDLLKINAIKISAGRDFDASIEELIQVLRGFGIAQIP